MTLGEPRGCIDLRGDERERWDWTGVVVVVLPYSPAPVSQSQSVAQDRRNSSGRTSLSDNNSATFVTTENSKNISQLLVKKKIFPNCVLESLKVNKNIVCAPRLSWSVGVIKELETTTIFHSAVHSQPVYNWSSTARTYRTE